MLQRGFVKRAAHLVARNEQGRPDEQPRECLGSHRVQEQLVLLPDDGAVSCPDDGHVDAGRVRKNRGIQVNDRNVTV